MQSRVVLPRRATVRGQPRRSFRHAPICRAEGVNVDTLRIQLDDMRAESLEVVESARKAAAARNNIIDVISGMDNLAVTCLQRGDEQRAREILKEKAELQQKADDTAEKLETLVRLDVKLQEAMQAKKTEILRLQAAAGNFRDDNISVEIKIDEQGKPYFERTGRKSVESPSADKFPSASSSGSSNQRPDYWAGPPPTAASSSSSVWSTPREERRYESRSALDSAFDDAVFSIDDLLSESDRRLDAKFLELERQQLERSLRSSGAMGPSAPPPPPPPPAPSAPPRSSVLSFQPVSPQADDALHKRGIIAEWWTMGQNSLMDGSLATLKRDHTPLFRDAAAAVLAITNARVKGQDPTPQQLLSLVVLSIVAPEQHSAGAFWGVDQPVGVRRMPQNVKLAIFGAALQYVVEDLLGSHSKILTGEQALRVKEARAVLVALASVLDLKSADASDFSVRVICRAIRVCMMNALVPLRRATREQKSELLAQAEADLAALHRLLSTLPCALPIATSHVAAQEVTEQLAKVLTPTDAMRLDSVYTSVSKEDNTCTTVRAILGPISQDR